MNKKLILVLVLVLVGSSASEALGRRGWRRGGCSGPACRGRVIVPWRGGVAVPRGGCPGGVCRVPAGGGVGGSVLPDPGVGSTAADPLMADLGVFNQLDGNPLWGVSDGKGHFFDPREFVMRDATGNVIARNVFLDRSGRVTNLVAATSAPSASSPSGAVASSKPTRSGSAWLQTSAGDCSGNMLRVVVTATRINIPNGRGGYFQAQANPGELVCEFPRGSRVYFRVNPGEGVELAQTYTGWDPARLNAEQWRVANLVKERYLPGGVPPTTATPTPTPDPAAGGGAPGSPDPLAERKVAGGAGAGAHDPAAGGGRPPATGNPYENWKKWFDEGVPWIPSEVAAAFGTDLVALEDELSCVDDRGNKSTYKLGTVYDRPEEGATPTSASFRAMVLPQAGMDGWYEEAGGFRRHSEESDRDWFLDQAEGAIPYSLEMAPRKAPNGKSVYQLRLQKTDGWKTLYCVVPSATAKSADAGSGLPAEKKEAKAEPGAATKQFWQNDPEKLTDQKLANLLETRCLSCHNNPEKRNPPVDNVAGFVVKDGKLGFKMRKDGPSLAMQMSQAVANIQRMIVSKDRPMPPASAKMSDADRDSLKKMVSEWNRVASELAAAEADAAIEEEEKTKK